ncbi:MAG: tryptophan--tRNA ligase [Pseudomonadota bacterium]
MTDAKHTPRVFSGVQPTGGLHLGNYLGAVKQFVDLQDSTFETIYCVVDLHAITAGWQGRSEMAEGTREIAAAFLACGMDPQRSILFNQSQVPVHAQLGWVFSCVARLGWMNRMTQFKDKAGKNSEKASLGLYAYPALQAADILAYHATHVPIGDDQRQHLELSRDIAAKFNNDFGAPDFFPLPEPMIEGAAPRVMSLRDGTKKMSKSDPSDLSRVNLMDDPDTIARKIRKAKTDPEPLAETIEALAGRPEALNLVTLFAALSETKPQDVLTEYGGREFSVFKPALADLAVEKIGGISARMRQLRADPAEIDRILGAGAERAAEIAEPILAETYEILGYIAGP